MGERAFGLQTCIKQFPLSSEERKRKREAEEEKRDGMAKAKRRRPIPTFCIHLRCCSPFGSLRVVFRGGAREGERPKDREGHKHGSMSDIEKQKQRVSDREGGKQENLKQRKQRKRVPGLPGELPRNSTLLSESRGEARHGSYTSFVIYACINSYKHIYIYIYKKPVNASEGVVRKPGGKNQKIKPGLAMARAFMPLQKRSSSELEDMWIWPSGCSCSVHRWPPQHKPYIQHTGQVLFKKIRSRPTAMVPCCNQRRHHLGHRSLAPQLRQGAGNKVDPDHVSCLPKAGLSGTELGDRLTHRGEEVPSGQD